MGFFAVNAHPAIFQLESAYLMWKGVNENLIRAVSAKVLRQADSKCIRFHDQYD
jgi:hypothetical protein